MTTPFDLLAEYHGPNGRGFDPDNLFFKALWELKNALCEDMSCFADGTHGKGVRTSHLHPEYVRRSREEAALLLPDAIFESGYGVEMSRGPHSTGHLWCGYVGWVMREADNWLDALSAAILAKEGVKADA